MLADQRGEQVEVLVDDGFDVTKGAHQHEAAGAAGRAKVDCGSRAHRPPEDDDILLTKAGEVLKSKVIYALRVLYNLLSRARDRPRSFLMRALLVNTVAWILRRQYINV